MDIKIRQVENGWIVSHEDEWDDDQKRTVERVFEYDDSGLSGSAQGSESQTFLHVLYYVTNLIGPDSAKSDFSEEQIQISLVRGDELDSEGDEDGKGN